MIKNPIKFGTDGWRAVIAEEFTFDNVRICAQGLSDYLKQTRLADSGLVIGYDTRFASEDFAAATAEVAAGNGIKVYLSPRSAPTQVVSYGVVTKKAGGAVIITASHNPAKYNGFKIKSPDGSSAAPEVVAEVEKNIARTFDDRKINRLPLPEAIKKGLVEYFDLEPPYLAQIARLIDLDKIKQARLKVLVDSMYGAGAGYFKTLLGGGAMEIIEINSERNPAFPGINPEPIAVNLKKLSARVKEERACIGLATDGDADRIGVVDENGNFLTQLQVYALLALYLLETKGERGAIIKTITTTTMLYRLGELFKVPVIETPVGFKYVAPLMMAENALIGGEESGGYGFRGHVPERDAILAGLYFLDFVVRTGKTPAQLLDYLYSKVGPHFYERIDTKFSEDQHQTVIRRIQQTKADSILGVKVAKVDTVDGFRFTLVDGTWLLIRFSGTEPVMRIYAESDSLDRVHKLLEYGRQMAGV
ncbi:MAG: phosphoglucomutase/phosphomannomutase family protein [Dehalococcoidia bacterium]|nr:phosphoglucomutase/phosphomannomutase family protein [Dehalococcoidia bacterium]